VSPGLQDRLVRRDLLVSPVPLDQQALRVVPVPLDQQVRKAALESRVQLAPPDHRVPLV
jgi:hypothetical protein